MTEKRVGGMYQFFASNRDIEQILNQVRLEFEILRLSNISNLVERFDTQSVFRDRTNPRSEILYFQLPDTPWSASSQLEFESGHSNCVKFVIPPRKEGLILESLFSYALPSKSLVLKKSRSLQRKLQSDAVCGSYYLLPDGGQKKFWSKNVFCGAVDAFKAGAKLKQTETSRTEMYPLLDSAAENQG